MKTKVYLFATLFIFVFSGVKAMSEMTITNKEGSPFYIIFDGEILDPHGAVLNIVDVRPGNHSVDVYRYIRDSRGYMTQYVEMTYRGSVQVGNKLRIIAHLTADGRLLISGRYPLTPPSAPPGKGKGQNGYHGKKGDAGKNGYSVSQTYAPSGGYCTMSPAELNTLMKMIREASFDQSKLTLAREALRYNTITADMIYQIMTLFSFEATKLEFAKWAYRRTSDPYNYYLVHRAFSFSSSITELSDYISGLEG